MTEPLEAIHDGRRVGRLTYSDDRLTFAYDDEWRGDSDAFPLSLSMPLVRPEYPDEVTRPFISGLLPDDAEVLRRWGQKFQVSPRNPFRLLAHVGEECAGAVQFVPLERASRDPRPVPSGRPCDAPGSRSSGATSSPNATRRSRSSGSSFPAITSSS